MRAIPRIPRSPWAGAGAPSHARRGLVVRTPSRACHGPVVRAHHPRSPWTRARVLSRARCGPVVRAHHPPHAVEGQAAVLCSHSSLCLRVSSLPAEIFPVFFPIKRGVWWTLDELFEQHVRPCGQSARSCPRTTAPSLRRPLSLAVRPSRCISENVHICMVRIASLAG